MRDAARSVLEELRAAEDSLARLGSDVDVQERRAVGRQHAQLAKQASLARAYLDLVEEIDIWREVLRGDDEAFAAEARRELPPLEEALKRRSEHLRLALLPRLPEDDGPAIVEIRAGTGGDEACLFAGDLLRMYQRHAERRSWKVHLLDVGEGPSGGVREAILEIEGDGVFGRLRRESGVHRVQRVPATESQGRIHTSAASVVVLPRPEEDDEMLAIPPCDLRIDTFRAGGAGGQHVNKTDSAVRMVHLPTGLVVVCQSERSQLQNKAAALRLLQARLADRRREESGRDQDEVRREAVGTGDRSGKIRTYNVPQDRVTDHRIGLTLHRLDALLAGELDVLLDALQLDEGQRLLRARGRELL